MISAVLGLIAAPAMADGAGNFVIVNGTDAALGQLTIRRAGTQDWAALVSAPAAGARAPVTFTNPDCAFDIRATVAGVGPLTWTSVNLCGAKSVTLQRDSAAGVWVDYDQ